MKLEQSFEVSAPLDRVWAALVDVERVAPCLPGAEVTGRNDDGSYNGTFKVKIGPTAAAYSGKLHMDEIDEAAHTATMNAQGTDRRGQGGAKATIVSSVSAVGEDSTRVEVITDYHITGRLARFGRGGMIEEISNRLLNEFAKCLQETLGVDRAEVPAAAEDSGAYETWVGVPAVSASEPEAAAEADGEADGEAEAQPVPEPKAELEPEPAPAPEPEPEPISEAAASAELAAIVTESDRAAEPEPAAASEPEPAALEPEPAAASEPEPAAPEPEPAAASEPEPAAPEPEADEAPFPGATPPPPSEPIHGLSLVGSVLWTRARRNPVPLAALIVGFLIALRVLRRRG